MLRFNDDHQPYFSLSDGDGSHQLYMQLRLSAPAVSPQTLRAGIDAVLAAADDSSDLWTPEKWTAASISFALWR